MTLIDTGRPVAVPPTRRPVVRAAMRAALELGLVFLLFQLYRLGRMIARDESSSAYEHAIDVRRLEQLLHLPSEAAIQAAVPSHALLQLANVYYVAAHFPTMIAFLVFGYLARPRGEYLWARNMVILQTLGGLVIHILFPLAPPRMFPQFGFLDTMRAFGPDAYAGTSGALANQFAAMPSLHIGWAVLIAYVVWRTGPRWLAGLATLHAVVTTVVVVVTANHWWLDGVIAVLLLVIAANIVRRPPLVGEGRRLVVREQPAPRTVRVAA